MSTVQPKARSSHPAPPPTDAGGGGDGPNQHVDASLRARDEALRFRAGGVHGDGLADAGRVRGVANGGAGFAGGRDGERPLAGAERTGAGRDSTDRGAAEAEGQGDGARGLAGSLDLPERPNTQGAGRGEAEHPMLTKLSRLVQVSVVCDACGEGRWSSPCSLCCRLSACEPTRLMGLVRAARVCVCA